MEKNEEKLRLWGLAVTDKDDGSLTQLCFKTREKALEFVRDDLHDRYHFDTNEPYITEEEYKTLCATADKELGQGGWWEDGEVTYWLEQVDVQG